MHQDVGKVDFTESQVQSYRASLWLWSVANNPNSSKSGAQDFKVLTDTTLPYDFTSSILDVLS